MKGEGPFFSSFIGKGSKCLNSFVEFKPEFLTGLNLLLSFLSFGLLFSFISSFVSALIEGKFLLEGYES